MFKNIVLILISLMMTLNSSFAQNNKEVEELVEGTKNDLMVVIGGGLAGAVLGLSTLSFVEEPKKHTRNIIVGASLGIIAGVGYVALSQANKSRDMIYGEGEEEASIDSKSFDTIHRVVWHDDQVAERSQIIQDPSQVSFQFSF